MKRVSLPLFAVGSYGVCVLFASLALAQVGPDGIDWVTVGSPGNRGYDGPDPSGLVAGRGSVNYEYKIGRFELTTAQWMEYANAFSARSDSVSAADLGTLLPFWGATLDETYQGPGTRYRLRNLPDAASIAVVGITWRQAAMYCNWLCNDKSSALSARLDGAYDASTFGYSSPGIFTDQATHHPGARYWIPTLDEWLKAGHFDPSGAGPNGESGRWWLYPTSSDTPPVYGPPGVGEANAGFSLPNAGQFNIPLGSYPQTQSPWGLFDTSGAAREWTEEITSDATALYRVYKGSVCSGGNRPDLSDRAYAMGAAWPIGPDFQGLRIASAVPSPSGLSVLLLAGGFTHLQRRRRPPCVGSPW